MKHIKTINELHKDTYYSFMYKKLYRDISNIDSEILLELKVTDENIWSKLYDILFKSIKNGNLEIVKIILNREELEVDPTYRNNRLFCTAVASNQIEIVKFLLTDSRVDPSAQGNYSIRVASKMGYTDMVKLLLQDERIDPSDYNNFSIEMASKNNHTDIVDILSKDIRVQEEDGMTEKQLKEYY